MYIFQDRKRITEIKDAICEEFQELIASKQLIVQEDFFVNAKELDVETLHKIRSAVLEFGMSYPKFGESIPKAWKDLHVELDKLREAGTKVLSYWAIKRINNRLASPLEEEELKVCIDFLHDIGYCLYFHGDELGKYVILEPKWIIDAMKVFVTCDRFGLQFWKKFDWMRMRSSGQVKESYITQQWRSKDRESYHQLKEYLLLVLQKLDILCRAKLYGRSGEDVNADFFTVPCMVNSTIPDTELLSKPTVEMTYAFPSVVPVAIYNRLVCACLSLWPVYDGHIYIGLVILKSGQFHCIVLQTKEGKILVSFLHLESLQKVDIHLCRTVRQFMNTALTDITETYASGKGPLFKISYNQEAMSRNFGSNDYEVLDDTVFRFKAPIDKCLQLLCHVVRGTKILGAT